MPLESNCVSLSRMENKDSNNQGGKDEVLEAIKSKLEIAKLVMRVCKFTAPFTTAAVAVKLVAYVLGFHRNLVLHSRSALLTIWNAFLFSETAFAVYCAYLKATRKRIYMPKDTGAEMRHKFFEKCLETVESPAGFAKRWLQNCDETSLNRGNVEEWLSWGFFTTNFACLSEEKKVEIEQYVTNIEEKLGHKLVPGHDGLVRPFKFSVEPIDSQHRPLFYYFFSHGFLQRMVAPLAYFFKGFGSLKSTPSFNFYVRKALDGSKAPIVLIHGMGVGVIPYLQLVQDLLVAGEEKHDIILLELPCVSQQVTTHQLLPEDFLRDLQLMMESEGISAARFVGHSYGTMCLAWIAKNAPCIAESFAFLDPGCFFLHDTTTLRAILYKEANDDAEMLFKYFLRSELFFNLHCRRHFLWLDNILFLEDISENTPALILVSELDDVMPVESICKAHEEKKLRHIDVLKLEGVTHGGFLFSNQREKVAKAILQLPGRQNAAKNNKK